MQTGYYAATGGMVAQVNKLDNISNNLANINTTGFKKDEEVIGDYLRLFKDSRDVLPLANQTKAAAKYINRNFARVPQIVELYTNFTQGALRKTGNPLDVAIRAKNLFFVVRKPDGNFALTRDGSFSISPQGTLVTKEGDSVMGTARGGQNYSPINISNLTSKMIIDKNGSIYTDNNTYIGLNLATVRVRNLKNLQKEGNNLYKTKNFNADVVNDSNSLALSQGFLETSNVNGVRQMSNLIGTSRLIDMYQKVMDTQMNEMNRDSINKLAVKG